VLPVGFAEPIAVDEPQLAEILNDVLDRLNSGQKIDREAVLAAHPEAREELSGILEGLGVFESEMDSGPIPIDPDPLKPRNSKKVDLEKGLVLGEYEILERIGSGGMGLVYKARQRSLDRVLALKVLPFAIASDEDRARFREEARLAARLRHPGIVQVHDLESVQGLHFYTMDFVDGRSLKAVIDDLRDGRIPREVLERIPPERKATFEGWPPKRAPGCATALLGVPWVLWVAEVGRQAAEALAQAHGQGIIHRDVKPSNLLLDASGRVFICDFGLARDLLASASFTAAGDVVGTPAFMSPEQVEGKKEEIGPPSDVYSLSLTLYEALTLRQPFAAGTSREILARILHFEPPRPRALNPSVPPDFEAITFRGMAREVRRRYPSAGELAEDLRRFQRGEPVRARRVTASYRLVTALRRKKWQCLSAVLGMALAVVLGISVVKPILTGQTVRVDATVALAAAWEAHESDRIEEARESARQALDLGGKYLDRELRGKAEFILGSCEHRLPEGDSDAGERHLTLAMVDGAGTIWDLRARLLLSERKLVEGNGEPAKVWLPRIEASLEEPEGYPGEEREELQALLDRTRLLLTKTAVAGGRLDEAREHLAKVDDRRRSEISSEANALRGALRIGGFVEVGHGFAWQDIRGVRGIDLDGKPPSELAVLTLEDLRIYHLEEESDGPDAEEKAMKLVPATICPEPIKVEAGFKFCGLSSGDLDLDGREEILLLKEKSEPSGHHYALQVYDWDAGPGGLRPLGDALRHSGGTYPDATVVVAHLTGGAGADLLLAPWYDPDGIEIWSFDPGSDSFSLHGRALERDGQPFKGKANALDVGDLDGDGIEEILAAVTGPRPAGYGLRVFGRSPDGTWRFRAGYLCGSAEDLEAPRAAFSACLALDLSDRPGLEILGSRQATGDPTWKRRYPGMTFGGLLSLGLGEGTEEPLLEPLGFTDVGRDMEDQILLGGDFVGNPRRDLVAFRVADRRRWWSVNLYSFEEGLRRTWCWPLLGRSFGEKGFARITVLDADGDDRPEILVLFEEGGYLFDFSPTEESTSRGVPDAGGGG
jgi:serine/threonine protein kinase